MQLCLTVTFIAGRYHGRIGENELEWPPSPLRLFQALIAASFRGAYGLINQNVRDRALRWLEKLDPPEIETGQTKPGGQSSRYVPNNDNQLAHIRTEKPMLAILLTDHTPVIYRWETNGTEEDLENAAIICTMACLVSHLGQHQDIVHMRGEISANETSRKDVNSSRSIFLATRQRDAIWESPDEGALEACQERYQGVLKGNPKEDYPIPSHHVDYQSASIIRYDEPIALFELWKSETMRLSFEPRDLRQPAAMTRYAMIEWLTANPSFRDHYGEELTSRLIGGHEPYQSDQPHNGAHIAFIPIPSLNKKATADGYIRRVLVIGFSCEAGITRELFSDAVNNLNGCTLKDRGRPIGILRRVEHDRDDPVLRFYIGRHKPSRVWRTVTPIVLTGLMRRGRPVASLVVRALRQAGIQESDVDSVAVFRGPIVPKTLPAMNYRVAGYLADTARYHAEVIFKRSLVGPLLVGRGRHSGLGLMMPWLPVQD